jgi:Flp pilus assembly protein TadD
MAIRALSQVPVNPVATDPRIASVVAAHLTDRARLVRVAAAEALMALGITQLEGARGQALARAQDEWADSLRTFNDIAADHTVLGWLEAARGRGEEAAKSLRVAITLDPRDPQPHVYLGVIAARAGRFDEALQHFKAAKALAPAYQNLDRLIEEASKRTAKDD